MTSLIAYYDNLMIGSVSSWLISPPPGWLLLDGTTHDKIDYPELWAVLPDGLKTGSDFTLPDMASTFMAGTAAVENIGDSAGLNEYNLTVGQLPPHTHTELPPIVGVEVGGAGVPLPSAAIGAPIASGSTGSGDDIDNRPAHVLFMFAIYAGRV
jgi:hypothetical protein